jgi:diguanylate cyclase (GGDEF)-like protein/PAS domain S-box-containing protein
MNSQDITERKRAEEAHLKSEARYRELVETIEDWIWEVDNNGVYTYSSRGVKDILGYEPEELSGKTPFDLMPSEEVKRLSDIFHSIMYEKKPIVSLINTYIHKNGGLVVLETSGKPFFDADGKLLGYRGVDRDITERKKLQDLLSEGKREWEETFDVINDAITIHDKEFSIIRANKAAARMFGLPFAKMVGQKCYRLYHGSDSPPEDCPFQAPKVVEPFTMERFESHINKFIEVKAFPQFDENNQFIRLVQVARDITERKRMEEQLYVLSITDVLTGLYNRRGFITLAQQQLKIAKRQRKGMFLLCADLDDFKEINDAFGHNTGDLALIETADILKDTFRDSDIIARIGGDEFVVLQLEDTASTSEILGSRLQKNLEISNAKNDRAYTLLLSTGTAYCEPESICSIDELLVKADRLMYQEKKMRRRSGLRHTA